MTQKMSVRLLDEIYSDARRGGGGGRRRRKEKTDQFVYGAQAPLCTPCIKDNKTKLHIIYQSTTHSKRHNSKFFSGPTHPDHPSLNILYR